MTPVETEVERLRDGQVFLLSEAVQHPVRVHRVRRITYHGDPYIEILYGSPPPLDTPLDTISFPIGYKVKVILS